MSSFVPVARPGTKGHPLLSRTGVPSWETGTTWVLQPGQINVFVVVFHPMLRTNVGGSSGENPIPDVPDEAVMASSMSFSF